MQATDAARTDTIDFQNIWLELEAPQLPCNIVKIKDPLRTNFASNREE